MKSILYVGATLMIGASIYGFVDYKKTSHSKEFGNLYGSKEITEPFKDIKKYEDLVVKEEPVAKEKIDVSIAKAETKAVSAVAVKKNKAAKKKKVNYKMFSRGSMEDKYIHKEALKPSPVKVEPVKAEIKKL